MDLPILGIPDLQKVFYLSGAKLNSILNLYVKFCMLNDTRNFITSCTISDVCFGFS